VGLLEFPQVRKALVIAFIALAAAQAATAAVEVRQMTDDTIVNGNSIRCDTNGGATHAQNSYYRRFHLPDNSVTGPFHVTGATVAIDIANDGADMGQPASLRVYSIPSGSPLQTANLTLLGFDDLTVDDSDAGQLLPGVLDATIAHPNTTDLVVEAFEPDGTGANNRLFFGSNTSPQTKVTYLRAPACSTAEITPLDTGLGADTHIILFATGDEGPDVDRPNLTVQIPAGQTLAGARKNGVSAKLSSGEPCGLDVTLLISKKLAHKLDIPRVVGTAHRELAKAGTKTVATDFTRKAKHALGGRHSLSLTVRSKATDDAHNAKTVTKSVSL
jgi:hypothetical protein